MAEIPTIPGSARVPDTQIGVKRDVTPRLRALGEARQTVGKANAEVQDAMGNVLEYEQRKQKAWEVAAFNNAATVTNKVTQGYASQLKQAKTEEAIKAIVPNWGKIASETKTNLLNNPDLTPAGKRRLEQHLDGWTGESTANFQSASDKLGSSYRKQLAINTSSEFLSTGDPAKMKNANKAIDSAVTAGDIWASEADKIKGTFPGRLQENQIRNGIMHDPYATLEGIDEGKYSKVPDDKLLTLRRQAQAAQNRVMKDTYDDLRTRSAKGEIFSRDYLNSLVKAHKMEGTSVDAMLRAQKGDVNEEENAVSASRVHDAILDIPRNSTPDQRLDSVVKIHGSKDYQSLTEQQKKDFDSALKPGKDSTSPIHRTQMEMMKKAFEEKEKQSEMAPSDYRAKYGHKLKQPDEESERIRYARAQREYADWMNTKKGQEATPDEATAERERLGFGEYHTAEDVKAALKAGKIERSMAKQILAGQFGIE